MLMKIDVKPECSMCKDIETGKDLIYECKKGLLISRSLGEFLTFDVKANHDMNS